ncbi:Clp protease N-terminal domain-containing protein [Streptomyces sp. P1-3]|uniref:Clp protease N-terminal domain-containing protein n=1 Tax=Streptomyces sp. P1-3 TaxID=3421658 RepID=UPI003D36C907
MAERLTMEARFVLVLAEDEARAQLQSSVDVHHVLLALLTQDENIGVRALRRLGVPLSAVRILLTEPKGWGRPNPPADPLPLTPGVQRVLELALREADLLGHEPVGPEHLLLGLIREGESRSARILIEHGAELSWTRQRVADLVSGTPESAVPAPEAPQPPLRPELAEWLRDLTQEARDAASPTVCGRDREIQRVMQVLMDGADPLLVGRPGTGRTSVVVGMAERMARGEAPGEFAGARIWAVDLAAFCRMYGDARGNLSATGLHMGKFREALDAMRERGAPVLFVDDMDRDLLAATTPLRWDVPVIGVIDPSGYERFQLDLSGLASRMRQVPISEPSHADTVEILKAHRTNCAAHHQVAITDDALEAAVALSVRHLPDEPLPGKAIDMLDEAGARASDPWAEEAIPVVDAVLVAEAYAALVAETYGPEAAEEAPQPPPEYPPPLDDDPGDRYLWAMS